MNVNKKHETLLQLLTEILYSFQSYFREGISEFELISKLKAKPFELFDEDALREPLVLFHTHFVLFHALYILRDEWRQEKVGELNISALEIKLEILAHQDAGHADADRLADADPLADYYLDWQNLSKTDEAEVEDLLNQFWQKMGGAKSVQEATPEEINAALALMELDEIDGLQMDELKRQYRKLQHAHHPDKGGTAEQAQSILAAYTTLHSAIRFSEP